MIKINLLPHRQIRRAERQREFGLMAALVAVVMAAILFVSWSYIKSRIEDQQSRNQRLQDEITRLDSEIVAITGLKDQIKRVLERKQIVEGLQSGRNQAVSVLDELARQLPEGVTLKSIKQSGNEIDLRGVADTNARVATLVHNLSSSMVMQSPNLVEIKANNSQPERKQFEFVLKVMLKQDKPDEAPASAAAAVPQG
ncbi:PilN domain-containing protein [Methylophilus aquaticus]|uniref:PilN domain-containing protein n=1 Tax=Methylophilus aquaticus TaxID=1971610 RepID=A0ABT9JPB7_9PROT|nr:PilN domain-containing protein [Methylophilus aquaticus]MDP8566420.1 PilN domain-containing protein [Methylophilus aquaticus]